MNDKRLQYLFQVLDRQKDLPALEALVHSLNAIEHTAEIESSIIALDANVLLRLANHPHGTDIIDFICTQDKVKSIILPGQVIQEFWNNHSEVIINIPDKLNREFEKFKKTVDKYNSESDLYPEICTITTVLDQFKENNKHLFDPNALKIIKDFLTSLTKKAHVPFVPREMFWKLAESRHKAKTPPGFKDSGDGDYFVWVDLLWGLMKLKDKGKDFSHVILLSNDNKKDWCKGFAAHPILIGEMKCLVSANFEIWNLDQLVKKLKELGYISASK